MINRIGATPSFQSYVNIKRDGMTKRQKEIVDREDFQMFADMLRSNSNPDVVRITPDKEDGESLIMDVVEWTGDPDLSVSVFTHKLGSEDAALNMGNLYFLYSGGHLDFDENGECQTGGTLKITDETELNYMT